MGLWTATALKRRSYPDFARQIPATKLLAKPTAAQANKGLFATLRMTIAKGS